MIDMVMGNLDRRAVRQIKAPEKRKYSFFIRTIDKTSSHNLGRVQNELLSAYKTGEIKKTEYLSLVKKIKLKVEDSKTTKKEEVAVKKEEKTKDTGRYFANVSAEKKVSEAKESEARPVAESPKKEGLLSSLLSNVNMRTGFFVIAMFGLLFIVTKGVLSSKGDGDLLIFGIVLVGLLVIISSSGSKKEADF